MSEDKILQSRPLSMEDKRSWIKDLITQYEDGLFKIGEVYRQAKEIMEMPEPGDNQNANHD